MKQFFLTSFVASFVAFFVLTAAVAQDEETPVRLTNLPHVLINTFGGRAISSKTTYVYARMWYVDENDNVTFYDSLEIRGRGNSTWGMAKKPYKLKFHRKEKLLGTGYAKTKKWTLLANHGDKTLLRNALTSLMGERAGLKFNPAAKFVDLTLNGNYVGNYQLSDQVDVRPHRVNVIEQDLPLTDDSDITGGYLLEADGFKDFNSSWHWDSETQSYLPPDGFYTTRSSVPVRIHYPDAEDLDERQSQYITGHVNLFEQRLYADDFADAERGYRPLVDSTSLAAWYLCTEMTGNVDGFFSTYFYKEQADPRLFWGPLWDYDIAYNNDNRTDRNGTSDTSRQLMKDNGYGAAKAWLQRMWKDPWFARLINRSYGELLDGDIEAYLNGKLDSLTALIDASQQRNYQRWGINQRTLRERVLYSSYDQYVADVRSYLARHLVYLKTAFASYLPEPEPGPEPEPEPKIPDFRTDGRTYYAISNSGTQTCFDLQDAERLCCNARNEESESQQWLVVPLTSGYLFLVNRATGEALNDPTEGAPTATTLIGTQLNVAPADSLDPRQQWDLVLQSGGRYNFVSLFSQHAANLSGGNAADGTAVLSYTSDGRNASSQNRLWRLTAVDTLPEPVGIELPEAGDYALAYDPASGRLHFGGDNLAGLTFPVRLYDANGRLVAAFRASEGTSLARQPRGLYVATWQEGARRRTVKFVR